MGTRVAVLLLPIAACASAQYIGSMSFPAPRSFVIQAVTGVPYSAEEVSESLQVLADGTRITHTEPLVKVYRDSHGRTRRERPIRFGPGGVQPGSPLLIEIEDPVERAKYVLDTMNRVAHRQELPPPGTEPPRVNRPAPPRTDAPRPESKFETLEPQTIDGIAVTGHRSTTTMPTGTIGNDRPITSTHESWFSPELKIGILSKSIDPRTGEFVHKVVNISRAEPDPALFQVPPDYTVVEEKDAFTIRWQ